MCQADVVPKKVPAAVLLRRMAEQEAQEAQHAQQEAQLAQQEAHHAQQEAQHAQQANGELQIASGRRSPESRTLMFLGCRS